MDKRPNRTELLFLNLGYNRFYNLFDEIMDDAFWQKEDWYRFSKVSAVFAIYSEILSYEPFSYVLQNLKTHRRPMESEIGGPLFKFVRNILIHFPVFERWNDVWISKELVNWQRNGLSVDSFLKKLVGHDEVKYRFWEAEKNRMTYITINFPKLYDSNKIYLKDIVSEKDGVKFSLIMMKQVLNTQVDAIEKKS